MINAGIFVFNDVELLDFAGPFEVFSAAMDDGGERLINVFAVSEKGENIHSVNGLKIQPDFSFSDHPEIDILVIPGGIGSRNEMLKTETIDWVKKNFIRSEITFSVCSGSRILGKAGLLDNIISTSHHEVLSEMMEIAPKTIIDENSRFIDNGRIMTSGGISAGIDLALHIVGKKYGIAVRDRAASHMEYGDWRK